MQYFCGIWHQKLYIYRGKGWNNITGIENISIGVVTKKLHYLRFGIRQMNQQGCPFLFVSSEAIGIKTQCPWWIPCVGLFSQGAYTISTNSTIRCECTRHTPTKHPYNYMGSFWFERSCWQNLYRINVTESGNQLPKTVVTPFKKSVKRTWQSQAESTWYQE